MPRNRGAREKRRKASRFPLGTTCAVSSVRGKDALEDAVEVIQILVRNHDLALVPLVLEDDLRPRRAGHPLLEIANRGALLFDLRAGGPRLVLRAAHERLGGTDIQPAAD